MITLVAGPPCSGKTSYVAERAVRGDLVLDSDALYRALSGLPLHDRPEQLRPFVWAAFWSVLRETRSSHIGTAWVIHSAASKARRQDYRQLNRATVVVLETPATLCAARARERYQQDDPRLEQTLQWIDEWWATYEPDARDDRVAG